MILQPQHQIFPATFEEFLRWEPVDGFKYEWNDGEVIGFGKIKKKHLVITRRMQQLFFHTVSFSKGGAFIMDRT